MSFPRVFRSYLAIVLTASVLQAQVPAQSSSSSSSSSKHVRRSAAAADSSVDGSEVSNGMYRNKNFGFSCKIPAGWVLRTEDMNSRDAEESDAPTGENKDSGVARKDAAAGSEQSKAAGDGKVLLAAFSRPPEAIAEDVNSSILIAAESVALYAGLKDAAQYLGPVTEVAKAQGFQVVNEPYEFIAGTKIVGTKMLARADFHKNVGTRVVRQSTLVMLGRGYAVSFTFIDGTDEEVEQLIEGLSFVGTTR